MTQTTTLTRPRKKARPTPPPSLDPGAVSNGSTRAHAHDSAEARNEKLLAAMVAFRDGDFSVRLPTHWSGSDARIAEAFNQAIGYTERMSSEIASAQCAGSQVRAARWCCSRGLARSSQSRAVASW
jgi:hypothetical protein